MLVTWLEEIEPNQDPTMKFPEILISYIECYLTMLLNFQSSLYSTRLFKTVIVEDLEKLSLLLVKILNRVLHGDHN